MPVATVIIKHGILYGRDSGKVSSVNEYHYIVLLSLSAQNLDSSLQLLFHPPQHSVDSFVFSIIDIARQKTVQPQHEQNNGRNG